MMLCTKVQDQMAVLHREVRSTQPAVDQLVDDSHNCRLLVEKSRSNTHRGGAHIDLDRIDADVARVTQRWNNICAQLTDRCVALLLTLKIKLGLFYMIVFF